MSKTGFELNLFRKVCSLGILLALVVCTLHTPAVAQFFLKNQFPNLSFLAPVGLYRLNDGTGRICVLEQQGVIRIFPDDSTVTTPGTFLDIHDSVISGGELGLLGLAFHPQFATNGFFYVDYTRNNPLRTVISRFHVSNSNPDSADPASEVILLQQLQPFANHNGGQLAFGPDGFLYIAFGDGGSGGDPFGNGQNLSTILGKILRINVDSVTGPVHYRIPADNPFAADTTKRGEIFAYGLRNPWKFSFDHHTIWCGDVGQNDWEEIDTITSGGNFGWNIMEGMHCYDPPSGCPTDGLTLPLWEYGHDGGRCAITGGFIYRGTSLPGLSGKFVYADFCTGEIWALATAVSGPPRNTHLVDAHTSISSFGEDGNQELYVCDYGGGRILKLSGALPSTPELVSPADHASGQPDIVDCSWNPASGAEAYEIQIALDSSFASPEVDDSSIGTTMRSGTLNGSTRYFWRVRALNGVGTSGFSPARSFTTAPVSIHYHPVIGWNIVSLPLDVEDGRRSALFPSAISNLFAYDPVNGYEIRDTVVPRPGYWIKFKDSATIGVAGALRLIDTIEVVEGWNLIGSLARTIAASGVSSIPGGIVTSRFFGYSGGYMTVDVIEAGKGYWIKANQGGKLVLSSLSTTADERVLIQFKPTTEFPPLPPKESALGPVNSSPVTFLLDQNYPNPFNPGTLIHYVVPVAGYVSLKIYNLLGEEVATIVDEFQNAGSMSVRWNAGDVPGGVYFYRLISRGTSEVRRMVFLK